MLIDFLFCGNSGKAKQFRESESRLPSVFGDRILTTFNIVDLEPFPYRPFRYADSLLFQGRLQFFHAGFVEHGGDSIGISKQQKEGGNTEDQVRPFHRF